MFDHQRITLKDVIRMVATYEGAHSISVSRLLQAEDQENRGPFRHPERHILDNVTVFGVKYTHIVVIESALYLYEKLVDAGHVEGPRRGRVEDKAVIRGAGGGRVFLGEAEVAWFRGRVDFGLRNG